LKGWRDPSLAAPFFPLTPHPYSNFGNHPYNKVMNLSSIQVVSDLYLRCSYQFIASVKSFNEFDAVFIYIGLQKRESRGLLGLRL
jgi:hypothetical protein